MPRVSVELAYVRWPVKFESLLFFCGPARTRPFSLIEPGENSRGGVAVKKSLVPARSELILQFLLGRFNNMFKLS